MKIKISYTQEQDCGGIRNTPIEEELLTPSEVSTLEEAEKWAKDLLDQFNQEETRRYANTAWLRILKTVEVVNDVESQRSLHSWEKVSLVTQSDRTGVYDRYKCSKCGATARRFGLSENFTPDSKSVDPRFCRDVKVREDKPRVTTGTPPTVPKVKEMAAKHGYDFQRVRGPEGPTFSFVPLEGRGCLVEPMTGNKYIQEHSVEEYERMLLEKLKNVGPVMGDIDVTLD